jgi:hypothetical protein
MGNPTLIKQGTAEAAVSPYRIVKFGAADGGYVQAAAATDFLVGVCESVGPALGERIDVIKAGIADVEFGGTVTRGGPVTADANGKAVAAAPAAGSNVRIIGFAEVSAVAGDIAPVLIEPGVMQG